MISEERVEKSLRYLAETDEKHAEVTANVKYLERQLKRSKALFITADTTLKSNYADFHTALKTVKDANPKD